MSDTDCPVDIEFADVQGNILTAYGKLGFPQGRFLLLLCGTSRRPGAPSWSCCAGA